MSLFPRTFGYNPSFAPLFQLLDDFDSYSRKFDGGLNRRLTPNFDVKELPDSYHLSGELPGVENGDVEMEFTDPQTLTIRGHSERSYTSGCLPAGSIEGAKASGALTEGEGSKMSKGATKNTGKGPPTKDTETAVARPEDSQQATEKYWVSERSYGEFAQSFNFPTSVDRDHVKASMKNGILSVIVPKIHKQEGLKITIS